MAVVASSAAVSSDQLVADERFGHGAAPAAADLCAACGRGDAKEAADLLASGADVNAREDRQGTALHLAAQNNHLEVVLLLLEQNADVNIANRSGQTPLHVAQSEEVSQALLRGFGHGVLDTLADRHAARQKVELNGAKHVVFRERPRGERQTVFDEFEHLETLYFGQGAAPAGGNGGDGGGGDGGDCGVFGKKAAEAGFGTLGHDGDDGGGDGGWAALVAEGEEEGQDAGLVPPGTTLHAEEESAIREQVQFVQKQYLSQERAERHKFVKYYRDFTDGLSVSSHDGRTDASFEFRRRLAKRMAEAGMDAEELQDRMEAEGIPEARAAAIASLGVDVQKQVGYSRGKDGQFKKNAGSGIAPPNPSELRTIARVLDHRHTDKEREDRSQLPGGIGSELGGSPLSKSWFRSAAPPPPLYEEDEAEDLETDEILLAGSPGAAAASPRSKKQVVPQVKAAGKYQLKKKPPPRAETPPDTDGTKMVCTFCGKHAPPVIDVASTWHLQQYYDDESDRLIRGYFCEQHNFTRLLMKRPTVATHIKSHLWRDLREASLLDRQHKYNRRLCARSGLFVCTVLNIIAIILAVFFLPLVVKEIRCASLSATSSHSFAFNLSQIDALRIETTRGKVSTRLGTGSSAEVLVHVSGTNEDALNLVEVVGHPVRDRVGKVTARRPGAGLNGEILPLTVTDCFRVDVDVLLPAGLNASGHRRAAEGLSLSVDQRWDVSDCTVTREQAWPFSVLPPRVVPACVVGRRVPIEEPVSIEVQLPGVRLAELELITNSGGIDARAIDVVAGMDARAARGFAVSELRAPRLAAYTTGGDIRVDSLDPSAPSEPVSVWLSRGEGHREIDDVALLLRDRGSVTANLTGLLPVDNDVRVHGGDADVSVRLVETTPWAGVLRSCGGRIQHSTERLDAEPLLEELPLICQQFFDNRWDMCKQFAVDARLAGKEHVTIEYAGNGFCDPDLNIDPCYDGGDCCASTCNSRKYPARCGMLMNATDGEPIPDLGYNCTDHWAHENFGDLPDCGSIMLAQKELHDEQMSVYTRPLLTLTEAAGWGGGRRSARPHNAGLPEAQMMPVPYTSVEGAPKGWGWHTCTVGQTDIFQPDRIRVGVDSPLFPRGQLSVDVTSGDVELRLQEAVGYDTAWRRHVQDKQRGIDCSIWQCDDEDECASSPCQHGGQCTESDINGNATGLAVGWYNCSCPWGFCGWDCDYKKEYSHYRITVTDVEQPSGYFCLAELWFDVARRDGSTVRLRGWRNSALPHVPGSEPLDPIVAMPSKNSTTSCYNHLTDTTEACFEKYAFDGYPTTAPCSSSATPLPAEFRLTFVDASGEFSPIHLTSYSIQAGADSSGEVGGPATTPIAWTLEGSRDNGTTYDVELDSQRVGPWAEEEARTFPLRTC